MNSTLTTAADISTITLEGRFDAHETDNFRFLVEPLVGKPSACVVIDFSEVVFIDSTALAELVRAMKHARSTEGDLILTSLSTPVRIILELTGLDRAFTIRNTESAARP